MYVDTAKVIKPTAVTIERISFDKCPNVTPNAITINENSLICATVKPDKKLFLFRFFIGSFLQQERYSFLTRAYLNIFPQKTL